jgi:hypothetical protein
MDRKEEGMKTWIWEWQGGGFNTTWAATKDEALANAVKLGQPGRPGAATLTPRKETLIQVGRQGAKKIEEKYAGAFD